MSKSKSSLFIYPHGFKAIGLFLILVGVIIFIYRITEHEIVDLTGFSFPVAFGLIFFFFSKEKTFDERIAYLKFKALAFAVPAGAFIAMWINYGFNFRAYSIETDSWFSISAFEYLSIVLVLAIIWFQLLKWKE